MIGSITAGGDLSGASLFGQVYLSGTFDSLRTDGREVKPWAVPAPGFDVEAIDGALPAGIYKVAVTAFGADGEESGAEPLIVRLGEGKALRVLSSDPRSVRVYVSPANASTLYSQGPLIGGAIAITKVDDQSATLTTIGLVPMPACLILAAYHGQGPYVERLLDAGADACVQDQRGNTALMGAIFKGELKIAQRLLATDCNPDQRNGAGQTAAMYAGRSPYRNCPCFWRRRARGRLPTRCGVTAGGERKWARNGRL